MEIRLRKIGRDAFQKTHLYSLPAKPFLSTLRPLPSWSNKTNGLGFATHYLTSTQKINNRFAACTSHICAMPRNTALGPIYITPHFAPCRTPRSSPLRALVFGPLQIPHHARTKVNTTPRTGFWTPSTSAPCRAPRSTPLRAPVLMVLGPLQFPHHAAHQGQHHSAHQFSIQI